MHFSEKIATDKYVQDTIYSQIEFLKFFLGPEVSELHHWKNCVK